MTAPVSTWQSQQPSHGVPSEPLELEQGVQKALAYLASRQSEEGSWKGDYGGPLFLLPMFVGTSYMTRLELSPSERSEMIRYMRNQQREDGGWGLHVEGHSHVFTTALHYVALRLLDVPAHDPQLVRGLRWLKAHGGPLASASWGKFFLALLNLYDYDGVPPVPPELWLLPEALPVHPSRLWCHCRMVYLPMSYLYGRRYRFPADVRIRELRDELYDQPYERIDWVAARERVSATDSYTPVSAVMKTANHVLQMYEKRPNEALRERALSFVLKQIAAEDKNTGYVCIGPINKLFHTLIWYLERPDGAEHRRHVERLRDYLWQADDGLKMQGYNSSELWDTAFALQAMAASGHVEEHRDVLRRGFDYVDRTQVRNDVEDRDACYRDPSVGGWPFSTWTHGWPITDCTAEGVKASLACEPWVERPLGEGRLKDAIQLILWFQNPDGGWATYERTRGPRWLELLNPSNCFADIMIDYSYVECTSASMQALAAFRERYPGELDAPIAAAIERGRQFILDIQREDGSWEGSWGICFTYGTWFGVEGLRTAGLPVEHPAIQKACRFLASKQLPDGGWGEHADSCRERRYIHTEEGQAVMTSWALLTLMAGGWRDRPETTHGLRFLVQRQRADGSFPEEHIAGMFNKTSAIHYDNYLKVFPLWALSKANLHSEG